MSRLGVIFCCLLVISCKKPPAPPAGDTPSPGGTINGTERIGWNQPAGDAFELATIGYAIYIDDTRRDLPGASCEELATAAGFACSAPLPALTPGDHTVAIAAFVTDGGQTLESPRSAALRVTVVPALTINLTPDTPLIVSTADGATMRAEIVVDAFEDITDIAFAPDGRLFVAERAGRIRVVRGGVVVTEPALTLDREIGAAGQLVSLAVDPAFERNGHVFAIYTSPSREGAPTFTLARFRAVADTLGDRIVLLDGIPASQPPRASVRVGPDARIYAAFDDGGDANSATDLSSLNGKILRLNADGTTPEDQRRGSPVFATGFHAPGAFDWDPDSGRLWIGDGSDSREGRLAALGQGVYRLPSGTDPASLLFYRGTRLPSLARTLLVGADAGRHLLRLRVEGTTAGNPPIALDLLLGDAAGGIRSLAEGPDGGLYFATAGAIGRLM